MTEPIHLAFRDSPIPLDAAGLKRTKAGKIRSNIHNAIQALLETPFTQGLFAFDLHRREIRILRPLRSVVGPCASAVTGDFNREDIGAIQAWFTAQFDMDLSATDTCAAITAVAHMCELNPVTAALDRHADSWDGQHRIDAWLPNYLNTPEATNYVHEVGRNWWIGAVGRIYEPGSETLPLHLIGSRTDVSQIFRTLADIVYPAGFFHLPFSDSPIPQLTRGALVVALDVEITRRRAADRPGTFLAMKEDEIRHPITRHYELVRRRATYVTNSRLPATIPLPLPIYAITVGRVDFEALRADARQLWAEAVHAVRVGARIESPKADSQNVVVPYADAAERAVVELRRRAGWQYESWSLVDIYEIAHPGVSTTNWPTSDQRRFAGALRREGMIPRKMEGGLKRWIFAPTHLVASSAP